MQSRLYTDLRDWGKAVSGDLGCIRHVFKETVRILHVMAYQFRNGSKFDVLFNRPLGRRFPVTSRLHRGSITSARTSVYWPTALSTPPKMPSEQHEWHTIECMHIQTCCGIGFANNAYCNVAHRSRLHTHTTTTTTTTTHHHTPPHTHTHTLLHVKLSYLASARHDIALAFDQKMIRIQ